MRNKVVHAINNWNKVVSRIKECVKVAEGFIYARVNKAEWMTDAQLQAWIEANHSKIGAI